MKAPKSMIHARWLGFFTNVAHEITKAIPRTAKSPLSYLNNPNLDFFFIPPCTCNEVSSVIQTLKNGKSCGPNSIPSKLLKILESPISINFSILINESFVIGICNRQAKIAKVIPVFKKGLAAKKSNFRQISLLSIFSKIFEKIMYQRFYNFLDMYEQMLNITFGFCKGH